MRIDEADIVSATDLNRNSKRYVDLAAAGKRLVVMSFNKPTAAIISMDDLRRLEELDDRANRDRRSQDGLPLVQPHILAHDTGPIPVGVASTGDTMCLDPGRHAVVVGPQAALLLSAALASAQWDGQLALGAHRPAVMIRHDINDDAELTIVTVAGNLGNEQRSRRFGDQLAGELDSRAQLLETHGLNTLSDYRAYIPDADPVSDFVVAIDGAQDAQKWDSTLVDVLKAILARGDDLGIHLWLFAQTPPTAFNVELFDQRIAGNVSGAHSRLLIDTAEAAFITDPGIFFQYVRPGPPTKFAMLAPTDDKPCAAAPSPDPAIAWPDSLHNDEVDLKELLDKHATTPQQFPIALQDDPHSRTQRPCFVDAGRNTVIVRDSPRSGSQLVQATVLSIAEQNSPSDVHIYVLSGEPGWSELANLAHVGACILAGDSDEDRLVKWLNGVVDDRIATSTGNAPEMPRQPETSTDIYLVITDALARTRWGRDAPESFERIVTNGPRVGVYTIAIEARDGWTRGPTPDWSVLDLSLSSRGGPRSVIATPHHEDLAAAVQAINHKWTGHQRATPIPALPEHISLREIQDTMPAQPDDSAKQRWRLPVGLMESTLKPLVLNVMADPHVLVFGENASGKTETLRTIAKAITDRNTPEQVKFVTIDYAGDLEGAVPDEYMVPSITLDDGTTAHTYITNNQELEKSAPLIRAGLEPRRQPANLSREDRARHSWWSGPEIVLLCDDWHQVITQHPLQYSALQAELAEFIQSSTSGFHFIASCLSAQMYTLTSLNRGALGVAWNRGGHVLIHSGNKHESPGKEIPIRKRRPGEALYMQCRQQRDTVQIATTPMPPELGGHHD